MFHDLKELLRANIKRAGIDRQVDAADVVGVFNKRREELVGDDLCHEVRAVYTRNQTLVLQCSSSLVTQEIYYRKESIIKALNSILGKQAVRQIACTH